MIKFVELFFQFLVIPTLLNAFSVQLICIGLNLITRTTIIMCEVRLNIKTGKRSMRRSAVKIAAF